MLHSRLPAPSVSLSPDTALGNPYPSKCVWIVNIFQTVFQGSFDGLQPRCLSPTLSLNCGFSPVPVGKGFKAPPVAFNILQRLGLSL